MCFINHNQVPWGLAKIRLLLPGKLIGAKYNGTLLKRIQIAGPNTIIERPVLKDNRRKIKLVRQFLAPLFAKVCRYDYQEPPFAFSPFLGNKKPGLDCLPQTHFIGQNGSAGERITEGEQGRFYLMRIEVHLCVGKHSGKLFNAVGSTTSGEIMCEVFGMVTG
jgi:hypothetical protein